MKHWDGRDRDDVTELRLPQPDRTRLAQLFGSPQPRRRRQPVHAGSLIGLVLAVGVVVGLALLLSPADPVSSKLLD
jgi:hypothetical protein